MIVSPDAVVVVLSGLRLMLVLGGSRGRSLTVGGGSTFVAVDRIPWRMRFWRPMTVGIDFCKYFRMSLLVSPGQDA